MSLSERIQQELTKAMLEKDELKKNVLRMAKAAIKNAEIAQMKTLDDAGVIGVLAKEVKVRRESIAEFTRLNQDETVKNLEKEIKILETYLPVPLTQEELKALVQGTIHEVNATSIKEMGAVMKVLTPKIQGRADGKLTSDMVRELLSSK